MGKKPPDRDPWRSLVAHPQRSSGTRQTREAMADYLKKWAQKQDLDTAELAVVTTTAYRAAERYHEVRQFAHVLGLIATFRLLRGELVTSHRDLLAATSIKAFADTGMTDLGGSDSSMRNYAPLLKRIKRRLCRDCPERSFLPTVPTGVGCDAG